MEWFVPLIFFPFLSFLTSSILHVQQKIVFFTYKKKRRW